MIRLLLLALTFMPPASLPVIAVPATAVIKKAPISLGGESTDEATRSTDDSDSGSAFTPMQEEIIAEHHSDFSPFLGFRWEKHVVLPTPPLSPVTLVDLFRPPKRA